LAGTRASRERRRAVAPSRPGSVRLGAKNPVGAPALTGPIRHPIPTLEGQWHATWAATLTRIILGLVFAWFGYHELADPRLWTGYVPVVPATSTASVVLVLVHGAVLFVLSAALVVGIAPRAAGAIGALLMVEIVISLGVSGINDIVVRDVGVLGLAVAVAVGQSRGVLLR
jgi:uncharacterized membrane protein YphA (DoxX/SURF4 family)